MDTDPETPEKGRRLTEAEWTQARTLFELGKKTKAELADLYGVSRQSIHKGLLARGAVYGSKSKEIERATIEAEKDARNKKVEEIDAFKDKQKKMVELLQNLTIRAVSDQVKKSKPISDAKSDIATLRAAMSTIRMGRDELYHLFDLHRDPDAGDELEELMVSEYTPDEIDALNKERLGISSGVDDDLAEIAASFENEDDGLDALFEE